MESNHSRGCRGSRAAGTLQPAAEALPAEAASYRLGDRPRIDLYGIRRVLLAPLTRPRAAVHKRPDPRRRLHTARAPAHPRTGIAGKHHTAARRPGRADNGAARSIVYTRPPEGRRARRAARQRAARHPGRWMRKGGKSKRPKARRSREQAKRPQATLRRPTPAPAVAQPWKMIYISACKRRMVVCATICATFAPKIAGGLNTAKNALLAFIFNGFVGIYETR